MTKDKLPLKLQPVEITISDTSMSLPDARAKALELLGKESAWLMASCPDKFVFQAFNANIDEEFLQNAYKVIFFGMKAEICWQKAGDREFARIIQEDKSGRPCWAREVKSLLRQQKGRLLQREYYESATIPDPTSQDQEMIDTGFLVHRYTRSCAIVDEA